MAVPRKKQQVEQWKYDVGQHVQFEEPTDERGQLTGKILDRCTEETGREYLIEHEAWSIALWVEEILITKVLR